MSNVVETRLQKMNRIVMLRTEKNTRLRQPWSKIPQCGSRLGRLPYEQKCRYRNVRPHSLPAGSHRFVGMARETAAMPPACKEGNNNKRSFTSIQMCHTHTRHTTHVTRHTCHMWFYIPEYAFWCQIQLLTGIVLLPVFATQSFRNKTAALALGSNMF